MQLFVVERKFRDGTGSGSTDVYICAAEDEEAVKYQPIVQSWIKACEQFKDTHKQNAPKSAADRWEEISIMGIPIDIAVPAKPYFSPFLPSEILAHGISYF